MINTDNCPCNTCDHEKKCIPFDGSCKKYNDYMQGIDTAKIAEKICDSYCKYPAEYLGQYKDTDEAQERLSIEQCENCPLNKLM